MEENNFFVVDASVVLKWLLEETNHTEEALKLYYDFGDGKVDLIAPVHIFTEVANTIGRKIPKAALACFSDLKQMRIREYMLSIELSSIAFKLMQKHPEISFYDAAYHALALQEGATFITADKRYYEHMKCEGNLMHLSEYAKK